MTQTRTNQLKVDSSRTPNFPQVFTRSYVGIQQLRLDLKLKETRHVIVHSYSLQIATKLTSFYTTPSIGHLIVFMYICFVFVNFFVTFSSCVRN
jgi:hypothetical protein